MNLTKFSPPCHYFGITIFQQELRKRRNGGSLCIKHGTSLIIVSHITAHVISNGILSYHTIIPSCITHHLMSRPILSYCVLFYPILSYHITSDQTTTYQTTVIIIGSILELASSPVAFINFKSS